MHRRAAIDNSQPIIADAYDFFALPVAGGSIFSQPPPNALYSATRFVETVVVLSGLEPGEKIAASGSFKLREGLRVEGGDALVH